MSGGYFSYKQYQIEQIADGIEDIVERETSPRPPIVKEKNLTARVWHEGCGSIHPVLTTSIEREHHRYKVHEDMREVTDITGNEKRRSFTATDYNDIRYEVSEWESEHYYDEDGKETNYYDYEPETIEEFCKAIKVLREAAVYAQRIDWLLSGDDGEETFHKRLKEELGKLKEQTNETDS